MVEFKPKVKNKYNILVKEYIKKCSEVEDIKECNMNIKVIIDNEQPIRGVLVIAKNKRGNSRKNIISSRNRNYNNIIKSSGNNE